MPATPSQSPCYDKPVWTLRALAAELPGLPGRLAALAGTVVDRPISGSLRERIMLAVATENRCGYCQAAHRTFGRMVGVSPREADRIIDGLDATDEDPEGLALRYARDRARRGFKSVDEALRARLAEHFDGPQLEAIEASARLMNLANRFGNSFDAARTRAVGGCDQTDASGLDLAVVSGAFIVGAATVAPLVGALRLIQR